jgi:PhzF family phenazine biosynthesis protein
MEIPAFQVDAFTANLFGGNPAMVCPLEEWLPDDTLQAIAMENNLSETAFLVKREDGYDLRWFTPAVEVDLCGHATLASAFVVFQFLEPRREEVTFSTASGPLTVTREGSRLAMDFPARAPEPVEPCFGLIEALGAQPVEVLAARDYLVVYENEDVVRGLEPDMRALLDIDLFAVIVTAPGRRSDFVSRFFAPAKGVDEDPVTGSAHCTLVPYWAKRLRKSKLEARQVSLRGGTLYCEHRGDRVTMAGEAALFLKGQIILP